MASLTCCLLCGGFGLGLVGADNLCAHCRLQEAAQRPFLRRLLSQSASTSLPAAPPTVPPAVPPGNGVRVAPLVKTVEDVLRVLRHCPRPGMLDYPTAPFLSEWLSPKALRLAARAALRADAAMLDAFTQLATSQISNTDDADSYAESLRAVDAVLNRITPVFKSPPEEGASNTQQLLKVVEVIIGRLPVAGVGDAMKRGGIEASVLIQPSDTCKLATASGISYYSAAAELLRDAAVILDREIELEGFIVDADVKSLLDFLIALRGMASQLRDAPDEFVCVRYLADSSRLCTDNLLKDLRASLQSPPAPPASTPPPMKQRLPPTTYWDLAGLFAGVGEKQWQLPLLYDGNVDYCMAILRELILDPTVDPATPPSPFRHRHAIDALERDFLRPLAAVPRPSVPVHGALLHGPPGTGKTTLIRKLLRHAGFAVAFNGTPSDLNDKYFGETERKLRALLGRASSVPGVPVVVFFDEIDAIASGRSSTASDTKVDILSCLLSRVGSPTLPNLLLLGGTNRRHAVDGALLRPGRMSVQVYVGYHSAIDRSELLDVVWRQKKIGQYCGEHKKKDFAAQFVTASQNCGGALVASALDAAAVAATALRGTPDAGAAAIAAALGKLRSGSAKDPDALQPLPLAARLRQNFRVQLRDVIIPRLFTFPNSGFDSSYGRCIISMAAGASWRANVFGSGSLSNSDGPRHLQSVSWEIDLLVPVGAEAQGLEAVARCIALCGKPDLLQHMDAARLEVQMPAGGSLSHELTLLVDEACSLGSFSSVVLVLDMDSLVLPVEEAQIHMAGATGTGADAGAARTVQSTFLRRDVFATVIALLRRLPRPEVVPLVNHGGGGAAAAAEAVEHGSVGGDPHALPSDDPPDLPPWRGVLALITTRSEFLLSELQRSLHIPLPPPAVLLQSTSGGGVAPSPSLWSWWDADVAGDGGVGGAFSKWVDRSNNRLDLMINAASQPYVTLSSGVSSPFVRGGVKFSRNMSASCSTGNVTHFSATDGLTIVALFASQAALPSSKSSFTVFSTTSSGGGKRLQVGFKSGHPFVYFDKTFTFTTTTPPAELQGEVVLATWVLRPSLLPVDTAATCFIGSTPTPCALVLRGHPWHGWDSIKDVQQQVGGSSDSEGTEEGEIAVVAVFTRVLSAKERAHCMAYFRSRYLLS